MNSLLAISLHPAVQRTHLYRTLKRGKVNRPNDSHLHFSGKGGNAALTAARFGVPSVHFTFWNSAERNLFKELSLREGVSLLGIDFDVQTRHCVTMVESSPRRATELAESIPPISDFPEDNFFWAFEAALKDVGFAILAGSRAPGISSALIDRLTDTLSFREIPFLVDMKGDDLKAALGRKPSAVKINREEWTQTFGELETTFEEVTAHSPWIWIVTDGKKPVWVSDEKGVRKIKVPHVRGWNPIGCGDVFNGVLAASRLRGRSWNEALENAIRASSESAKDWRSAWVDPFEI